jgi:hypothetical protein
VSSTLPKGWFLCQRCDGRFFKTRNVEGRCAHPGVWHDSFPFGCGTMDCVLNLPSHMGKPHWSCCYDVDVESFPCPRSDKHTSPAMLAAPTRSVDEVAKEK